jgi:hypothetical protein
MSLITDMRRQYAVWWKRSVTPDKFGNFTFDPPIEIQCRWVEQLGQILDKDGEAVNTRSTVYVDRVMSIGDCLAKGILTTNTPLDPRPEYGAIPIVGWKDTPDFDAVEHLLTAYL